MSTESILPTAAVDGTMLALVLLAISSAPWEDRAGAMMAAILDQPGKTTAAKVTTYLSGIRVSAVPACPAALCSAQVLDFRQVVSMC